MNKMESINGTIFLSLDKDTKIKDIVGTIGVFGSRRFRKIAEKEDSILFEIIPEVELGIRKLRY